jgi:hypothetical protein
MWWAESRRSSRSQYKAMLYFGGKGKMITNVVAILTPHLLAPKSPGFRCLYRIQMGKLEYRFDPEMDERVLTGPLAQRSRPPG